MSNRSAYHAQLRKQHIPTIKAFCDDLGLTYVMIHGYEWHIRVQGLMDVFPTRNRYHLLKTGARGGFNDYEELGRIFEEYVNQEEFNW